MITIVAVDKAWKVAGVSLLICLLSFSPARAQVTVSGSVQSDVLIPQEDEAIGATTDSDWGKTNTYVDLKLQYTPQQSSTFSLDAGVRGEYLDHPLPGYENDFAGWGVRHAYVTGKLQHIELTLGSFYEQFGSGFILRTYEERSLGIDNALMGARLTLKPVDGITIKALSGRQRRYWEFNSGLVSGADAEVSLDQWLSSLRNHDTRLTLGASWVNKYEKDETVFADPTHKVNLPKYVNSWEVRASLNSGPWGLLAEYAQKTDDPSADNNYSFGKGTAAMLSASYSQKGMSLLLQTKRSENMSSRSRRSMYGTSSFINHLPAFTLDHTYALAALYPYATQLTLGEWAYQAELGYNFKRRTAIGGKYGMNVKVNFSYVRAIDNDGGYAAPGTGRYKSSFLKWGDETYYHDFDIQLTRKLTRDLKLTLMYMNQRYNKTVVEGEGGMIHSNVFIADGMYQIAPKTRLRTELQYLTTADDQGDWAYGLVELSLAPHWMFTVSDMWNCGETKNHYYQGLVTLNIGSHRFAAGYGRTRSGLNCSGGVCRYVPATRGFTLNYNYNF